MFKKIVSMILICAMLIPLSSAVAADNTSVQPTIEEILNGYHEKAFEAQIAPDAATASAYSRQADRSSKTLEQETVDELTAAGYEAYNVTNENYNELEDSLKTDFSELGLNPDGSYIVVISGEDPATPANSTRGSDLLLPPHVDNGDNSGGDTFTYTEDGTTYRMRYVTLVSADFPSELFVTADFMTSNIDPTEEFVELFTETTLSIVTEVSAVPYLGLVCTIASFLGGTYEIATSGALTALDPYTLVFRTGSQWTRSYIQVYNTDNGWWYTSQCSSYAYSMAHFDGPYILNAETGVMEEFRSDTVELTTYSPYYNNLPMRKSQAVKGFKTRTPLYDCTGDIGFTFTSPTGEVNFGITDGPLITHKESALDLIANMQEE